MRRLLTEAQFVHWASNSVSDHILLSPCCLLLPLPGGDLVLRLGEAATGLPATRQSPQSHVSTLLLLPTRCCDWARRWRQTCGLRAPRPALTTAATDTSWRGACERCVTPPLLLLLQLLLRLVLSLQLLLRSVLSLVLSLVLVPPLLQLVLVMLPPPQ